MLLFSYAEDIYCLHKYLYTESLKNIYAKNLEKVFVGLTNLAAHCSC